MDFKTQVDYARIADKNITKSKDSVYQKVVQQIELYSNAGYFNVIVEVPKPFANEVSRLLLSKKKIVSLMRIKYDNRKPTNYAELNIYWGPTKNPNQALSEDDKLSQAKWKKKFLGDKKDNKSWKDRL